MKRKSVKISIIIGILIMLVGSSIQITASSNDKKTTSSDLEDNLPSEFDDKISLSYDEFTYAKVDVKFYGETYSAYIRMVRFFPILNWFVFWYYSAWSDDPSVGTVADITVTDSTGEVHHYKANNSCRIDMVLFIGLHDLIPLWDPNGGSLSGRTLFLSVETY